MLHNLRPASGSRKKSKRIARGNSGHGGTTGGRGTKGQQARAGKGRRHGFEGGQVPMIRRQPKLGGFTRSRRIEFEVLNLEIVEKKLPEGSYTVEDLIAKKLVRNGKNIKLLARGSVSKKYDLQVHAASKSAKEAVRKAGGSVTVVKN